MKQSQVEKVDFFLDIINDLFFIIWYQDIRHGLQTTYYAGKHDLIT